MKAGTEYELYVKEVYERLFKKEGKDDIEVKHNIFLKGTTGVDYQIDLYWEFDVVNVKHKVVIECKDYNTYVSKEKINAFHDKLNDIGGVKGVYVTKKGYQSGAKEIADKYGITLIEMRKPNEKDWEGKIKEIDLNLQLYFQDVYDFSIDVDKNWLEKQNEKTIKEVEIKGHRFNTESTYILDKNTNDKKSIKNIINELTWNKIQGEQEFTKANDNLYLIVEERNLEIKINTIRFKYRYNIGKQQIKIDGEKSIKAIIKDSITGEVSTMPYIQY